MLFNGTTAAPRPSAMGKAMISHESPVFESCERTVDSRVHGTAASGSGIESHLYVVSSRGIGDR